MGVPYQMVYDKKYCKSILEKVTVDYIIMSKLNYKNISGNMPNDKWDFSIRIYDVTSNKQIDSELKGSDIEFKEFCNFITVNFDKLINELNTVTNTG